MKKCQLFQLVANRIADCKPEWISYLANPNDAYYFSIQSNEPIRIKCPICGHEDTVIVGNWFYQGKKCSVCSDGISFPEKIMMSILKQLNIDYIYQAGKKRGNLIWAKGFRYDFMFTIADNNYLIEMDGRQHEDMKQQFIDKEKDLLASQNNFHLIRIDCGYKNKERLSFIKNSILNSDLSNLLSLDKIDWKQCGQFATSTFIETVCSLWEDNGLSIKSIINKVGLSHQTIWKYLKEGNKLGLCPSYSVEEVTKRRSIRKYKQYKMINNNEVVKEEIGYDITL